MTEKNLVNELKEGKEQAYQIIFSKYYEWLCNYIYKLSNNYQLSEDIVQDVFVKLWEKRESIVIKSSLKNYLFKVCHNQFLQHLRKEKIKLDFLDSVRWDVLYEIYNTDEEQVLQTKINALRSLIDKLPPKCKEVFVKGKLEGKKYKEIAIDMNISIKTVEAQMSKALHFFRKQTISLLLLLFFL
jgi:RNA polymerase sigma-70 factor (ECF subfamily)